MSPCEHVSGIVGGRGGEPPPCFNTIPPSRSGVSRLQLGAPIQPASDFYKYTFWGHSTLSSLHIVYDCFPTTIAGSVCNGGPLTHRARSSYNWALCRKSLLMPVRATHRSIEHSCPRSSLYRMLAELLNYPEPNPLICKIGIRLMTLSY